MSTHHVVILIGSDTDPNSLLHAAGKFPLGGYNGMVTVIASRTTADTGAFPLHQVKAGSSLFDRIATFFGIAALGRFLVRFPLGRLINSLSPTDQSRVFYRAVRRDPTAVRLMSSATLLVAADLASVRTAWSALKSGTVPRAMYTLAAARRDLSRP